MAVPGRRNGVMGEEDDEDDVLFDDGDALADLDLESDVPPHLRALVEAAESGNVDALRSALEHLDVVKLLLAAGASPKKTNIYGKISAELADQDTEVRSILAAAAASADEVPCQ
ncbi:hypothetical protein BHE74_00044165 [Ensete ventricosum]|uniref:Uncharacterized protein n=1 Tax=Ensete ventricosum TaxID=4639 RepID=A0A444BZP6_ENSVE|nr:hypothetical protein GW17_00059793 [Ensete ventricosum]RWW49634.1 hypothetical protein BHE74_00044165 [Ensete ventricosum]RZR74144.1 hypothetical protein BHM03_00032444 [Ensete ventricosum]